MEATQHPQTNGGRLVKRGDSFDPECWRTTHRLRVAQGIISGLGIEMSYEHTSECPRHPDKLRNVVHSYQGRVVCMCGRDEHGADWPEWVTGRVFDLAYQLANEVQTKRGEHERGLAAAAKAASGR